MWNTIETGVSPMAITILGGQAKGLSLRVPPKDSMRPMAVRLKRKLFDAHQDLSEHHFVDLCAGTGAVGLEAWSRGARSVLFYEKNQKIFHNLLKNLDHFQSHYDCEKRSLRAIRENCLKYFLNSSERADHILFFAPPYPYHQLYHQVFEGITRTPFRGQLWVESDRQKGLPLEDIQSYFTPQKVYKQGTTFNYDLSFFMRP